MKRHFVAQALLFAVIAVLSLVFGYRYIGSDLALSGGMVVHSTVPDGQGLKPGMRAAYRGVDVGQIVDTRIAPGGREVELDIRIGDGVQIPEASVAQVVTSSALGDRYLDIRPESSTGPYLQEGGRLFVPPELRAVPLSELIGTIATTVESLDAGALETLGENIAVAVDGNGPELATIIDTSAKIAKAVRRQAPTLRGILVDSTPLVQELAGRQESLTGSLGTVRNISEQLLRKQDDLVYLLDHTPEGMNRAQRLLDENRETGAGLLSNMLVVTPVVRDRTPALEAGLVSGPEGLRALSGAVRGNRMDFSLVATQGPVCVYPTARRPIGDESPPGAGPRPVLPSPGQSEPARFPRRTAAQ